MNFEKIVILILSSIFINNIIFTKIIGLLAFFEETKKIKSAFSIGITTTVIMTFSSSLSWLINKFILIPFNIEDLGTIIYVLIIILIGYFLNNLAHLLKLTHYSPLSDIGIIANSTVLGVVLINIESNLSFFENLVTSIFLGVGYLLALLISAGINERLEETEVPEAFKGIPITMISMGIVAMVFMGFFGIKG